MKQKILTTEKVKEYIKKEVSQSEYVDILKKKLQEFYYFTDQLSYPGTYIFSDNKGYHSIGVGDRGKKYLDKNPKDIESLCFSIYWELATSIAFANSYENVGDWRRGAFPKVIEILLSINLKYGMLGKQKINEILKNNPYNDELYK